MSEKTRRYKDPADPNEGEWTAARVTRQPQTAYQLINAQAAIIERQAGLLQSGEDLLRERDAEHITDLVTIAELCEHLKFHNEGVPCGACIALLALLAEGE